MTTSRDERDEWLEADGLGGFAASRFVVGPSWAEYPHADAVLSNIRLRGLGCRFEYPSVEDGVGQILGALHE